MSSSSLDKDALAHLAKLARIALDPAEEERLLKDLGEILEHFKVLGELDLSDVPPMAGGTDLVGDAIFHRRQEPDAIPVFPCVTYQTFNRFAPDYTLGRGNARYVGSYKIVGWTQDDPRTPNDIAMAIEEAVVADPSTYPLVGGHQILILRNEEQVDDEDDDNRGDDHRYHQSGAIYHMELTA